MEKFRVKQIQKLLRKAGESEGNKKALKQPHKGKINADLFGGILNDMIDAEEFIYTSRPTHFLGQEDARIFCQQIIIVRNKIDDILADFGVIEKESVEVEIEKLSEKFLILTTKTGFKKVITRWGVNPQRVIVAGVPLQLEDMEEINPHIPENALKAIEKKIKQVKNDIERKKDQFNVEYILVVVEKDKTGEILGKRAKDLYNANIISTENLKDLNPAEFMDLLQEQLF
jgi:hypothetical protein